MIKLKVKSLEINRFKPALVLLPLIISSCTTLNPATGGRDFTPFMSAAKEDQIGKDSHPAMMAQSGGEISDQNLKNYVALIGAKLSAKSELPNKKFTFTVLNSPQINAFAMPGGYVYVTRGILSLFNDEAEMASVIGHEIGHVTARHSAKRQTTGMLAGLGTILAGVLTKNEDVVKIVGQASQLGVMSYSRGQEKQSDMLGVRYSTKAGYDPYGAARMLSSLDRNHELVSLIAGQAYNKSASDFSSTHPNTEKRRQEAYSEAQKTGIKEGMRNIGRNRYLMAINGIMYGNDPKEGVITGSNFTHPVSRFSFDAPQGYVLQNSPAAVYARGATEATKDGLIVFGGAKITNGDMNAYINSVWKSSVSDTASLQKVRSLTINGMNGLVGAGEVVQNDTTLIVQLTAFKFTETMGYYFINVTPKASYARLASRQQDAIKSFRKISAREASKYKGKRVKVVTVKRGDTFSSLSAKMAFTDHKMERFLTMNGMTKTSQLKSGQLVKLVVFDQ